ncbi:MAG: UbiA family prenyltransferase, partial [Proteobacteria bacterium]|nr:UbiA family prenyltransferase [Pseudomonadota bacterium]
MIGFLKLLCRQMNYYMTDIRLLHTLFTLPFGVIAIILSWEQVALRINQVILIFLTFFASRSYAMGWNRICDRHFDRANPRTAQRMIPANKLSLSWAICFTSISGVLVVVFSTLIQHDLWPYACVLLILFTGYSYMKRIHLLVHVYLGICLGLLPIAVTIALGASLTPSIYLLALAITIWVTGFDILYALQDKEFDHRTQLHSVPSRLG